MNEIPKDIERLINRSLDGALSDDEALALDRELIRNPEARRLMDELRDNDHVAGLALEDALGDAGVPFDVSSLPDRGRVVADRVGMWGRWLAPGAVAAALLGLVVAQFPFGAPNARRDVAVDPDHSTPIAVRPPVARAIDTVRPPMLNVGTGRPRVNRNTGIDVFGVMGDDGNIYWIQVDRVRTVRRPARSDPF